LITIAKSMDDGYTPTEQTQEIYQKVLKKLREVFKDFSLNVHDQGGDLEERAHQLLLRQSIKYKNSLCSSNGKRKLQLLKEHGMDCF
jgi:hypothetical protein